MVLLLSQYTLLLFHAHGVIALFVHEPGAKVQWVNLLWGAKICILANEPWSYKHAEPQLGLHCTLPPGRKRARLSTGIVIVFHVFPWLWKAIWNKQWMWQSKHVLMVYETGCCKISISENRDILSSSCKNRLYKKTKRSEVHGKCF